LLLPLISLAGCAINPATQKREFVLMGEEQEIEVSRQLNEKILEA
jgi:hypothetical protein